MKLSHIMILLIALSAPRSNVIAEQLYVAPHGSDNILRAQNSENSPWQTLGRATWGSTNPLSPNTAEAAQPGDVVIVKAGVYTTTQTLGQRDLPTYNPVNTGSAGNPIVFRAASGEHVILQGFSGTTDGALIGANNRSYITWDGFIINEPAIATSPDTGPVVVWNSNNITLQNLTIIGKTADWNDNHNGIRLEFVTDSLVRSNRISGIRNAPNNGNGAAIMVYDSEGIVFEYNEIRDSGGGIFLKGRNPGPFILRYNVLHHIDGAAITILGVADGGGSSNEIYQNLVYNSREGIIFSSIDAAGPANVDVVNNTFHNLSSAAVYIDDDDTGYADLVIRNNLFTGARTGIQAEELPNASALNDFNINNNTYFGFNQMARLDYDDLSLSQWQSQTGKDSNSTANDPLYVNQGQNDFTLSAGSPAIDEGIDLLNLQGGGTSSLINLGAYINGTAVNDIGPQNGPVTLPSPPTITAH